MATIKDIALLTGTSSTAVSFVLNNKDRKRVSPEKRKAILEAAKKYGYRKNIAARGLALKRTFKIATCVQGFFEQHPVFGFLDQYQTISLLARKLPAIGYGMEFVQVDTEASPSEISRTLAQEKADGFVFAYWDPQLLRRVIPSLKQKGIPAVALGTMLGRDYDWAAIDREGGFCKATSYLLGSGLTRIALLDCGLGLYGGSKRAGYEKAMQAAGYSPHPVFSAESPKIKPVSEATERMVDACPEIEAVLISENLFAPTVMHALGGRRVRIIGCGDRCFANICHPKLSYLEFPGRKLVDVCIDNVIGQIESPDTHRSRQTIVECDLVIQET